MNTPIPPVAAALGSLALVTPQKNQGYQPTNSAWKSQPPPLLFHYEGENVVELNSDITDHYVEDNSAVNDQIALKPEIVRVHGFIGELNDIAPANYLPILAAVAPVLTSLGAFSPEFTTTGLNAYNEGMQAYQTITNAAGSAVSAWMGTGAGVIDSNGLSTFNPETGKVGRFQTKQQVMFQQFYGYQRSRTLFTVQTPWAIFKNMAIQSLQAMQDEKTRVITDFVVTFKMIRFAKTLNSTTPILSGRAANQGAAQVNNGSTSGTPSTQTVAEAITAMGG